MPNSRVAFVFLSNSFSSRSYLHTRKLLGVCRRHRAATPPHAAAGGGGPIRRREVRGLDTAQQNLKMISGMFVWIYFPICNICVRHNGFIFFQFVFRKRVKNLLFIRFFFSLSLEMLEKLSERLMLKLKLVSDLSLRKCSSHVGVTVKYGEKIENIF